MNHKLKKSLVSNFKATDPQIVYLNLASTAIILNTGAIIGMPRGKKFDKGTRVSYLIY